MKTTLLLFLASVGCFAQGGNTVIVNFPGAPSGTCAPIMVAVNNATGEYFDCLSGSWNSVGGTGGGITIDTTAITGGGANRILFESATNKVSESANLTWDGTVLGVSNGANSILEVANHASGGTSVSGFSLYYNSSASTPSSVSTATGTDGGSIEIDAFSGGSTTIATTGTGGSGASIYMFAGNGGVANSANTASTGGNGGSFQISSGSGADATVASGINIGGTSGDILLSPGSGGNAANGSSNTGGDAGSIVFALSAGGSGGTANGTDGEFRITGSSPVVFKIARSGYYEMYEQTAPSAPAANTARIYVQDNGAGKTQVCALFSSGAAQCFATQP